MNIEIIIVEDSNLGPVPELAAAAATQRFRLSEMGIEVHPHAFTQITDVNSLEAVGRSLANDRNFDGRIVIIDMQLHAAGCPIHEIVAYHDRMIPEPLRMQNERDRRIAGGRIATWMALQSQAPRQLLIYATEEANAVRLHQMAQLFRDNGHPELCYDLLDGGLDPQETRVERIVTAVGKWLEKFGLPRARLWPDFCSSWFSDDNLTTVVPHNFRGASHTYTQALTQYIGGVFQKPGSAVADCLQRTADSELGVALHNYLKGIVGSHAAAHAGAGYHLRWNHLPFLAAACTPPSERWIFTDALLRDCPSDILPPKHHGMEQSLIDYLVGGRTGTPQGLFRLILTDTKDSTKSNLSECSWTKESFVMRLEFSISKSSGGREALAKKFERSKVNNSAPGGSAANEVFAAWKFLRSLDLDLSLDENLNGLAIRRL